MEAISVAVALPDGEIAPGIVSAIEAHPFLDLCGIARSLPDLLRLLERFRPAVMLVSPSFLEELDPSSLGANGSARLSAPVTFLLSRADMTWEKERLPELLRLPLRHGGLMDARGAAEDDLFGEIKEKVDVYRAGERLTSHQERRGGESCGDTGLFTVIGCKGGVGTTLISCALAAAMSSAGRRVLLMEMWRDVSQLQQLKPRDEGKSLLELLPLAEELSWDLIRASVYRHAAGFHLLPYRDSGEPAAEAAVPEALLRNLLFLFDLVVQDLSACSMRGLPSLLHHDPEVLLVSLPDMLAATCACSVAARLRKTGLGYDRLHLVVNRCGSHHALSPPEMARATATGLLAALPDDARSGLDFAELGELPHAGSPLGKAVGEAAAALGHGSAPAVRPNPLRRFARSRRQPEGSS